VPTPQPSPHDGECTEATNLFVQLGRLEPETVHCLSGPLVTVSIRLSLDRAMIPRPEETMEPDEPRRCHPEGRSTASYGCRVMRDS